MPSEQTRPSLRHAFCLAVALAVSALDGCSSLRVETPNPGRVTALLPADALLLGEQHDAAEHQRIERQSIEALAQSGQLAALAIEMAEEGQSTAQLPSAATQAQVQAALHWNEQAWPWSAYGPVVMAAVRAGVPVLGANLKRARMKEAMADATLDAQLSEAAFAAQQAAVRSGHCDLLPESQIIPMTRIQIARDRAMAQTLLNARVPGQTVLLISGAAHGDKRLGVPLHLPADFSVKVLRLQAGSGDEESGRFDALWLTPALPEKDYCESLRRSS